MTFRRGLVVAACGVGAVLWGPRSFAQDYKGQAKKGADRVNKDQEGQEHGDADAEMMAAWTKAAAPCEFHGYLEPLVGKWNTTSKFRHDEDAPWSTSTGESVIKWVLGGRHIVENVESTSPEMPFVGMGITGYDKLKKKYVSVWIDSMSTTQMVSTGTIDDSHKVITFTGTFDDVMTGEKDKPQKTVLRFINDKKIVVEMYQRDEAGKWYMNLEVAYTRAS